MTNHAVTALLCASCDKEVVDSELSGARMIAGQLIDYQICRDCVKLAQPAALGYQQGLNERKNFWIRVWDKLEKKYG
jgi:hypothetical protein